MAFIKWTPEERATWARRQALRQATGAFERKERRVEAKRVKRAAKKLKIGKNAPKGSCKTCGEPVKWVKENDRWQCYNAGTNVIHWDTCSKRKWEQVKATGERFETPTETGYARSVHGTKLGSITGEWITGSDYQHDPSCQNCVPPWEVCPHCPDSIRQLLGGSEGDSAQKTRQGRFPF